MNEQNTPCTVFDAESFLWNDVAELKDANCRFILVKTMLESAEDILAIGQAEFADLSGEFAQGVLSGQLLVQMPAQSVSDTTARMELRIPFAVESETDIDQGSILAENYVTAQLVDARHILTECVISVPQSRIPARDKTKIGHFERKFRLQLPDELPNPAEIIGTTVNNRTALCETAESKSALALETIIGILYAQDAESGERIMYYESADHVELQAEQPITAEAETVCYAVSAQIEDDTIVITMYQRVFGDWLAEQTTPEESQIADEDAEKTEAAMQTVAETAECSEAELLCSTESPSKKADVPADGSSTESSRYQSWRRESLDRHMHPLDGGVRTPTIVRKIEFRK